MPQTTSAFGTAGVTRAWTDANQNFVPDCDLLNPAAQDLRASGGDLCGVVSNTSFGKNVLTNNFDPGILNGWGVRPSDWSLGVSIQQQIGRRSSVDVTYTRRWYHGFSVVDNRALQPSDLTPFSIVAPADPRLPGGGGYVVSGLYDVVPEKAGQVDNYVTDSTTYGRWYQYFNGIDATVTGTGRKRLHARGGHEHGSDGRRQLRRARTPSRVRHHIDGHQRVWSGPGRLGRHPGEPLLSCRVRRAHAVPRSVLVHNPEGERAGGGDVSEQAGGDR